MEQRQALAGFALSAALFALAVPVPTPEWEECLNPTESADIAQHTATVRCEAPQLRAAEIRGPARRLFGLPIELNCADARTFESLDRIGSVRARQIVEERARAPFDRVEDLLRVQGIGPKTLENLRSAVAANPRVGESGSVDFPECHSEAVRNFRLGAGGWM
jgi:hypothetical protein